MSCYLWYILQWDEVILGNKAVATLSTKSFSFHFRSITQSEQWRVILPVNIVQLCVCQSWVDYKFHCDSLTLHFCWTDMYICRIIFWYDNFMIIIKKKRNCTWQFLCTWINGHTVLTLTISKHKLRKLDLMRVLC